MNNIKYYRKSIIKILSFLNKFMYYFNFLFFSKKKRKKRKKKFFCLFIY